MVDLKGYKKVAEWQEERTSRTFNWVTMYNKDTDDSIDIKTSAFSNYGNKNNGEERDFTSDYTKDVLKKLENEKIDLEYNRIRLERMGIIAIGSTVEVVKGRNIKIGTVAKVIDRYNYTNYAGKILTTYIVLEGAGKTNIKNCVLVPNI